MTQSEGGDSANRGRRAGLRGWQAGVGTPQKKPINARRVVLHLAGVGNTSCTDKAGLLNNMASRKRGVEEKGGGVPFSHFGPVAAKGSGVIESLDKTRCR